jgi:hypothetical protein
MYVPGASEGHSRSCYLDIQGSWLAEAEILEDVQGALWSRPTIDAARLNAYGSARITCQRSPDHAEFTGWVLL